MSFCDPTCPSPRSHSSLLQFYFGSLTDSDSQLIISVPDPTCQVITDLDPDPDPSKVSDPGGSGYVTLIRKKLKKYEDEIETYNVIISLATYPRTSLTLLEVPDSAFRITLSNGLNILVCIDSMNSTVWWCSDSASMNLSLYSLEIKWKNC